MDEAVADEVVIEDPTRVEKPIKALVFRLETVMDEAVTDDPNMVEKPI